MNFWQMLFAPEIEARFRVATWHGFAVYGAVPDASKTVYGEKYRGNFLSLGYGSMASACSHRCRYVADYPGDTELHLVWDIDQSKLVGEGTNDVELVRKLCVPRMLGLVISQAHRAHVCQQ